MFHQTWKCFKFAVERIVYEATGSYHRCLEDALSVAGLPLVKVNPLQARRFAQACGVRAKTDSVDASMLARMGMALQPELTAVPSKIQRDLKALQSARQALIKDGTAAKNRSCQLSCALLIAQNKRRLRQIELDLKDKAAAFTSESKRRSISFVFASGFRKTAHTFSSDALLMRL